MKSTSFLVLGIQDYIASSSRKVFHTFRAPNKKKAWEKIKRTNDMNRLRNKELFRKVT